MEKKKNEKTFGSVDKNTQHLHNQEQNLNQEQAIEKGR